MCILVSWGTWRIIAEHNRQLRLLAFFNSQLLVDMLVTQSTIERHFARIPVKFQVQKKKVAAKPSPAETAANTIVLSAEDEKKLVAIQAGARGYLARKKVAEQKSSIKVNR